MIALSASSPLDDDEISTEFCRNRILHFWDVLCNLQRYPNHQHLQASTLGSLTFWGALYVQGR